MTVIVPFALGFVLASLLPAGYRGPAATTTTFGIFLGIALTITAFPVLARILRDRGLLHTPLGAAALTCAAINDVVAWTLAAVALGQTGSSTAHLVFVAFASGMALSRAPALSHRLVRWLAYPVALLLPAVFAVSGLRTDLGSLATPSAWATCVLITLLAAAGTMGGAAAAARTQGHGWRNALQLGALLNTRGLMGLVVLNMGLDRGLITPVFFAMLVVMAIAATAATTPLLAVLGLPGQRPALQSPGARSTR